MRVPSSLRIARDARASACLAVAAGSFLLPTGCGSPNRTVSVPTPSSTITPAGSRFAGVYAGNWTYSAGFAAGATPTFAGPMSLTIDRNGSIAAVFTDTLGAGQGTFSAAGTVDEAGTITYVSPSPNLVGERTFSGVAAVNSTGTLTASGTLFFDYPGTSSWSAIGQPAHS